MLFIFFLSFFFFYPIRIQLLLWLNLLNYDIIVQCIQERPDRTFFFSGDWWLLPSAFLVFSYQQRGPSVELMKFSLQLCFETQARPPFSRRLVNFLHMIRHIRPLRPLSLSQATHSTTLNQTKSLAGGKRCLKTDIKNSISSHSWQKPGFFPPWYWSNNRRHPFNSLNKQTPTREEERQPRQFFHLFVWLWRPSSPARAFCVALFASKVFSAPKSQCKYKDVPFQKWKTTPASLRNHSKCSQPHSETFYL